MNKTDLNNLENIMKMISWDSDFETQESGIKEAEKLKDIGPLIQPMDYGSKAVWENCAKIISKKSDAELQPYLLSLFEWLQDMNWPGSIIIFERLKTYGAELIMLPLEESVKVAIENEDRIWLLGLYDLINSGILKEKINKFYLCELQRNYDNWITEE